MSNPALAPVNLARLACPDCRDAVTRTGDSLVCARGHRYDIKGDVPVLLTTATSNAIEADRSVAENVRLRRSLGRNKTLLRVVEALRPPHPFKYMRWRKNRPLRELFSNVVARNNPPPDALFLDIGSGILGGQNASGLSSFIRERVVALEIDAASGVGVVGDAHSLPWRDGVADGVLIQGVLEHVRNPERVASEIFRVLKPGAPVYADVPFQQHYHLDPLDFRRWTSYGFNDLFSAFENVDSGACAGPAAALTDMLTEFPAVLFARPAAYWLAKSVAGWIFSPVQLLDFFWSARPRAHTIAGAVYFLGVKPKRTG